MSGAPEASSAGAAALVWCPFPDEEAAAAAVGVLLDEGLVACANIVPGVRSLFVWQSVRGEAREAGVLLKTSSRLLDAAIERVCAIHPYETPVAIGWRCDGATAATLAWLGGIGSPAP